MKSKNKVDPNLADTLDLIGKKAAFHMDVNGNDERIEMDIKGIISENGTMRVCGFNPLNKKEKISMLLINVDIID